MLAALLSGASCLIYEIVWCRYLQLILGISVHAVATVLACFMLGMAIGAWHLGKWVDRSPSSVRLLLWMQIAVGVFILLSPLAYEAIRSAPPSMRAMLAIAAMLPPTYLMGGTFPAFVKTVARQHDRIGAHVGRIYAVNTLGAAIGAFITGFVLIGTIGLSKSLYLAGICNFVVATIIFLVLRNPITTIEKKPSHKKAPSSAPSSIYLALIVIGISGFTGLAYEIYWTRILTYFFRDSIYDLSLVLTTFLMGLVIGGIIGGRIRIDPRIGLGLTEILIGLCSMSGLFLISRFPYWINYLQTNTVLVERYHDRYWLAGNAIRFGYAFALMLIPTCLFGMTFPLISRMVVKDVNTLGRRLGLISGVNTLCAAAGSVAAGFVFISWLGLRDSVILTAMLNIAAGLLLLRGWLIGIACALAVLVIGALAPQWDQLRMSTSFLDQNQEIEKLLSLQFYREDATGMTSVVELIPLQRRYLVTNRLFTQSISAMMGLDDHRRLGHIPMLLHPNPTSALVVGLGAGITLRGVADHPATLIDCVELSEGVIEAAGKFSVENNSVTKNPKVHMIVDDGRHFIGTSSKQYDVIVLDIFHPMSGSSSMSYSQEYFALCRKRLAPGGLICQWLPAHQLSLAQIKTITRTFQSIFPHTSLWYGMIGDSISVVGCIGSAEKLSIDYQTLSNRLNQPSLSKELREINLQSPELLLSHFIMADDDLATFCADQPIDTDNRPVIEFAAPKIALKGPQQGMMNLLDLSQSTRGIELYIVNIQNATNLDQHRAAKKAIIDGFRFVMNGDQEARLKLYRDALRDNPGNEDLIYSVNQLAPP